MSVEAKRVSWITLLVAWAVTPLIVAFLVAGVADFFKYQSILEGNYETPWYSQNWLCEPYTNLRLASYPAYYYAATNADHSQMWIVKEHAVGNKKFWTVDYRMFLHEAK